jgi:hypothetical protein
MKVVLTPAGRFLSVNSAARHHKVTSDTVRDRIRKARPGWRYGEPYQIPAGFVPLASSPRRRGGRPRARNTTLRSEDGEPP